MKFRAAVGDLQLLLKWRIYCHRNLRTCHKRLLLGGWQPSPLFYSSKMSGRERGEGRIKLPQSVNIGVFNVRGCSTNEVKKGEIGKMFLRRRLDVCALSETKLRARGGWQRVWCGGREGERRGGPFTESGV